jgi:hypothetical protein
MLIKGTIHQKEIIINLYAPNVSAPSFIKHTLKDLKAHIDSNTVVVRDFNTPLSPIDRSFKQNMSKEILELNDSINQKDLTDVLIIFHPTTTHSTIYILLSSPWICLQNISYLRHKASLNKYKKTEITLCLVTMH